MLVQCYGVPNTYFLLGRWGGSSVGGSIVYLIINALKGHKQCQLQMIIISD